MRKISIDSIKGNEILAKKVWSDSDVILMSEGITLKKEYVARLKELNIEYVYVEDDLAKGIDLDEMNDLQIKEQCQSIVKDTIERYSYNGNGELGNIRDVAEEIINDILEQPEVMFNISGIRKKSEFIYSHSINVCTLAILIALKIKIPRNKVRDIAVGSLLHDIGFNYVNFDYNNKNFEDLTVDEKKEIKKHVVYGYSAVEKESWLSSVAKDIILSHHELLNGEGYPFRLTKDKIRIGSKIVSVCDKFDRLVYGCFTKKMKVHEAIEYIVSQSNRKYDAKIVQIFIESVAAFPNGTTVITNENEIGIVLRQNYKFPARPVIRMIYDNKGNKYKDWIEKDLTKVLTLFIKDTVESF